MHPIRLVRPTLAALTLAVLAGCGGSDSTGTTPPPGGNTPGTIAVALTGAPASIQAGASGTVTATVTRAGGFAGAVAISVEGLPAGVTASADPASIPAASGSSVITLTTSSTAAAGTTNVTVRAKGTGVTDAATTLSLVVTAAPVAPTPAYTLTLVTPTLSVAAGASVTSKVAVARSGGFAGAVTLAVTGAPAGVIATTSAFTGDTATLTVTAGAAAAASTATLTITGTAAGLVNRTATAALTVTAAPGGGVTPGNIPWQFCDVTNLPAWFAVQDGNGAWTRVIGANNLYKFNLTAGRGGVAFVTQNAGSQTYVFFGTTAELTDLGTQQCLSGSSTVKKVNGSVAGLGAGEAAMINFGGRGASPTANGAFSIDSAADGPRDLIAGKSATTFSGGGISTALSKIIIRRGLNPAAGSSIPVLDFGAAEAFTPITKNFTINGVGADQTTLTVGYTTATSSSAALYVDISLSAAVTRQYYGVPAAQQLAGDRHFASAVAIASGASATAFTSRLATLFFKDAVDKTVTLGASPSAAAITVASTTPFPRLRAVSARQAEYGNLFTATYAQINGVSSRSVFVYETVGYLAGAASWDVTMPDLTTVAGWDTAWSLRSGVSTMTTTIGTGYTYPAGQSGGAPTTDGMVVKQGLRVQTVTP
ncbi:MAG: hypothetical protein ABI601_17140 [bacterium]